MTLYYEKMMEKGDKYATFIQELYQSKGINMFFYQTKTFQFEVGENNLNIEIKLDCNYKKTGNLYIETHEKTNENIKNWTESGIYRKDKSEEYLIGDYDNYWKFPIRTLKTLHKKNKYKNTETKTSKGYLLPINVADNIAVKWSKKDDLLFRQTR
tara:strand:+ start:30 stop:494 length:465 start_codon:yes stop_codon:yes gene_type:complete